MILSKIYLEALIQNDRKRIEMIYEECYPPIKAFILNNSGNQEDAKDIFQKALLQIAMRYKRETFEITGDFQIYLFAVCRNLWRREINKSKRKVTNREVGNIYIEETDSALALLEQKREELFTEKLTLISENCKKVLSLYFSKIPYSEIVKTLNYQSETVVRQRVFKCKKKLTELIKSDKRYLSLKEL